MVPALQILFTTAAVLATQFLVVTPVAIEDSAESSELVSDNCAAEVAEETVPKRSSKAKSTSRRVNFDESLHCLAMNVYHEARSESRAGQIAVASVTLNRVKSKKFPGSVCNVVKQGGQKRNRCQFSWWCDGKDDEPMNDKAWDKSVEIGRLSLMGIAGDPTNGALFYHADYVKPSWSRSFERSARIGKHLFYKPTERLRTAARD